MVGIGISLSWPGDAGPHTAAETTAASPRGQHLGFATPTPPSRGLRERWRSLEGGQTTRRTSGVTSWGSHSGTRWTGPHRSGRVFPGSPIVQAPCGSRVVVCLLCSAAVLEDVVVSTFRGASGAAPALGSPGANGKGSERGDSGVLGLFDQGVHRARDANWRARRAKGAADCTGPPKTRAPSGAGVARRRCCGQLR